MKRLIVLLSALLLAVMPVQAKAQEQSDVTAKCYTEAGSVEGLEVSLYKVGDVSGGKLTFTDDYVGIKAPSLSSAKELQACAQAAESRIKGSGYKPGYTAKADKDGVVKFGSVPYGMYCAVSGTSRSGERVYSIVPVLILVDRDMSVELKMDVETIKAPDKTEKKTSVSVTKKWELSKNTQKSTVTIDLYRDGTAVDSVELSEKNRWAYTWTDLDAGSVWTVAERRVPDGFVAELSGKDGKFTITNRAVESLRVTPQTGIESRPVLPAIIALAAIVALLIIILKKVKEN